MSDRLRALVLCAGLGTRLRPLTLSVPKPLVPVCGRPVAARTLDSLVAHGCELAAINLHHRGGAVRDQFGVVYGPLPLVYSEEREILGTLGALGPLRDTLRDATEIILVNGDALCDWPWSKLLATHRKHGAAATLLLHKTASPTAYGGGVGVDSRGCVVQMRDSEPIGEVARRFVFTGAHILDPALLDELPTGPADIVADLYLPLLAAGRAIHTVTINRPWHDLGTPARYRDAALDWGRGNVPRRLWRGAWRGEGVEVAEDALVHRVVLEEGARVESGAEVTDSLLLPGAVVGRGSRVRGSLVGPRVVLPADSRIEDRLVHNVIAGYKPPPGASVLGNRVYAPIV